MRLDVARSARIVVLAPGATDLRGLFENQEVALAARPQAQAHADAGEAGAHDDDPHGSRRAGAIASGREAQSSRAA